MAYIEKRAHKNSKISYCARVRQAGFLKIVSHLRVISLGEGDLADVAGSAQEICWHNKIPVQSVTFYGLVEGICLLLLENMRL